MAELNAKPQATNGKRKRVRKTAPKVDLTAMVDLAFLLITFFMLTTSLNKPHRLDVATPDKSNGSVANMDERRVVSVLVGQDHIAMYQGSFDKPLSPPKVLNSDKNEFRDALAKFRDIVPQQTNGNDMIVLIKPSESSRAIDLINTFDELKIAQIKRYMLSKITAQEEELLLAAR